MDSASVSGAAYVGRFAPSPTGPLHFGSLVTAVGSYLDARRRGGLWRLRMEDVDFPRNVPGAADDILATLENLGFEWDGEVLWQSARLDAYRAALEALRARGLAFPCGCTRKEIADSQSSHVPGTELRYPGVCRGGLPAGREARAWRLRVAPGVIAFTDRVQGRRAQDVMAAIGDFVLIRADGLFAYQLAVVVDDAAQSVTDVVRGADLLDSTARQIALQRALGLPEPVYLHLPVAANAAGEKLSKQTRARALSGLAPAALLADALAFLGQPLPPEAACLPLPELWSWALAHWDVSRIPRCRSMPAPEGM